MSDTLEQFKISDLGATAPKLQPPPEIRIMLHVCDCFRHDNLTLITIQAQAVAKLLQLTTKDLELIAIAAMLSGKPQVAACYPQRDVAEEILINLVALTPFISRSCHRFYLE